MLGNHLFESYRLNCHYGRKKKSSKLLLHFVKHTKELLICQHKQKRILICQQKKIRMNHRLGRSLID